MGGTAIVNLRCELLDAVNALRRDDPELSQVRPYRIREHRALPHEQLARSWSINIAWLSADLTGTNRMVGRVTASAIASASAASVLLRLTYAFT
jgi:hypothetical protein